jgi:hypothetical protein
MPVDTRVGQFGCGLLPVLGLVAVASALAGRVAADELADVLAAHKGEALDLVELGTGTRFVRPTLENLVVKDGRVVSLRIRPEDQPQAVSVTMPTITKIVVGRETVHEAEVRGRSATQIRAKRAKERYATQVAESRERMRTNGVEPWPDLSAEQHATTVAELEAFVEQVRARFPKLVVSRTHEFLVATDIPAAQMAPFVAGLDRMHDFLCDLYGIPRGEPVWQGKCLVVAFLSEDDFRAFEDGFMQSRLRGMHGICHQRSDGRVITACHRGDDGPAFAHMLVHETSHGFNHRWMSPVRLPNWLNEGIAEWVGTKVVPGCDQVPLKEARAVEAMRSRRDVGPGFFEADNIEPVQYGIASGLVRFMATRDATKFAAFVKGIKEGAPVEAALRESFGASLDDLLAGYGRTIGVPDLHR